MSWVQNLAAWRHAHTQRDGLCEACTHILFMHATQHSVAMKRRVQKCFGGCLCDCRRSVFTQFKRDRDKRSNRNITLDLSVSSSPSRNSSWQVRKACHIVALLRSSTYSGEICSRWTLVSFIRMHAEIEDFFVLLAPTCGLTDVLLWCSPHLPNNNICCITNWMCLSG